MLNQLLNTYKIAKFYFFIKSNVMYLGLIIFISVKKIECIFDLYIYEVENEKTKLYFVMCLFSIFDTFFGFGYFCGSKKGDELNKEEEEVKKKISVYVDK